MIVLPMAGLSSRFFKAGYTLPKYMLDLEGQSVFAHALGSFAGLFKSERFLIICRDIADTAAFVQAEAATLGLPSGALDLVVLETETAGQAETVAEGLVRAGTQPGSPLTIFNIDTFRPGFIHPEGVDLDSIDGYLETFHGAGTHWSFVRSANGEDETTRWGRAVEVTEKVRISDRCSTGLYHFRSVQGFLDLYARIAKRNPDSLQGGERYIAPLYNIAIQAGQDIRYRMIDREEVHFCGTPDEYEALRAAAGQLPGYMR